MTEPNYLAIRQTALKTAHSSNTGNFNGSKILMLHPLEAIIICTKCHGNRSNSCQNVSLIAENVNCFVALQKTSGNHQSYYNSSLSNH